jgi:hypothetical protein
MRVNRARVTLKERLRLTHARGLIEQKCVSRENRSRKFAMTAGVDPDIDARYAGIASPAMIGMARSS